MRKEFLQTLRDPSSIGIAFLLPVVLLILFGYGVSLDAKGVPLALVDEVASTKTRELLAGFRISPYFDARTYLHFREAETDLIARRIDGIVRIRQDFTARLRFGREAPVQVIVNGVDSNTARLIEGYVEGVRARWLGARAREHGTDRIVPVRLESRVWFNREVRSRNFLVPGLIAVIMTLIGSLLTALVVAREWERGTMETLLAAPTRMNEILLGKIVPYFLLGMGGMAFSVAMAVWLFDVPLRGSIAILFLASALFLLAALGMGLLISTVTRNQFVASQSAILATFLPAFILSGMIYDIRSMPPLIQAVTYLVSARYFVSILQTVFLAGNAWSVIVPNTVALAAIAAIFLGLARWRSRLRLE
jgi:ABC-2 type transport system permease protein